MHAVKEQLKQILIRSRFDNEKLDSTAEEIITLFNSQNKKKLSPVQVREIRAYHRRGESQADIAYLYGVNPATVSRIVRGEYH